MNKNYFISETKLPYIVFTYLRNKILHVMSFHSHYLTQQLGNWYKLDKLLVVVIT